MHLWSQLTPRANSPHLGAVPPSGPFPPLHPRFTAIFPPKGSAWSAIKCEAPGIGSPSEVALLSQSGAQLVYQSSHASQGGPKIQPPASTG